MTERIILNLTQHAGTKAQANDGLLEATPEDREVIRALLTFEEPPRAHELSSRASALADIVESYATTHRVGHVMLGGAPYLVVELARELGRRGLVPVYAFTRRESVEEMQADGSVVKRNVFRHLGWVEGPAQV